VWEEKVSKALHGIKGYRQINSRNESHINKPGMQLISTILLLIFFAGTGDLNAATKKDSTKYHFHNDIAKDLPNCKLTELKVKNFLVFKTGKTGEGPL
jgi:hypothetical protein